jgi:hypothetical protein
MRSLRWRKCGLLTLALNRTAQQHCFRKTEGRVSHSNISWRVVGIWFVSLFGLSRLCGWTNERGLTDPHTR